MNANKMELIWFVLVSKETRNAKENITLIVVLKKVQHFTLVMTEKKKLFAGIIRFFGKIVFNLEGRKS